MNEAFLQREKREGTNVFRRLLLQQVGAGLVEALVERVDSLCGPSYYLRPFAKSSFRKAEPAGAECKAR